jgi:hypothetical protein
MTTGFEQFGPAGPHVEALMGRCVLLTSQEAELLAGAWSTDLADRDAWGDDDRSRSILGWPKRKAAERRVTARMRARNLTGHAARTASGVAGSYPGLRAS